MILKGTSDIDVTELKIKNMKTIAILALAGAAFIATSCQQQPQTTTASGVVIPAVVKCKK